jgi:hypothetical protein
MTRRERWKLGGDEMTRLNELDRLEMWDVCRRMRPDWTGEKFEEHWKEFCRLKEQHAKS